MIDDALIIMAVCFLLNLTGSGKPVRVADQLLVATSAQVPLPAECDLNVMETAYVSAVVGMASFLCSCQMLTWMLWNSLEQDLMNTTPTTLYKHYHVHNLEISAAVSI
jgi:hypothetical protein